MQPVHQPTAATPTARPIRLKPGVAEWPPLLTPELVTGVIAVQRAIEALPAGQIRDDLLANFNDWLLRGYLAPFGGVLAAPGERGADASVLAILRTVFDGIDEADTVASVMERLDVATDVASASISEATAGLRPIVVYLATLGADGLGAFAKLGVEGMTSRLRDLAGAAEADAKSAAEALATLPPAELRAFSTALQADPDAICASVQRAMAHLGSSAQPSPRGDPLLDLDRDLMIERAEPRRGEGGA
jgi:hypothetical protein